MDNRSDREILLDMEKRLAYTEYRMRLMTLISILKTVVIVALIIVLAVVLTPHIKELVSGYKELMVQVDKLSDMADTVTTGFDNIMEKLQPVIDFFNR